MIINGKEIKIFDYLIKNYSDQYEPEYTKIIKVYIENSTRKQLNENIVSGENDLVIDNVNYKAKYHGYLSGGTTKRTYLFLSKD